MRALHEKFKYQNIIIALILYHFGISFLAYIFIRINSGDAKSYWFIIKDASDFMRQKPLPFRENLMYYINYFFATTLQLPFWIGFLLYSSIGLIGIYYFYLTIKKLQVAGNYYFLPFMVLLLPSLHFWTSIIGKEPICFLSISLVFYSLKLKKNFILTLILSFTLLALIRPHVAIILAFCLLLAEIINNRKIKLIPISLFVLFSIVSLYVLLKSHWLQGLSIESLQHLFQTHHTVFRSTNTYVPLEDYNILYRIFTYYYRPLPFEFNTWLGWSTGTENLLSLIITTSGVLALIKLIKKFNYQLKTIELSIILFYILLALIFTLAYSNFGLISRMKNQSFPFFLMLCLYWIRLYLNKNHEQT